MYNGAAAIDIDSLEDDNSWTLTQPQSDFYWLNCRYPAFVGGYGSGKTQAMIVRAMHDKFLWPKGTIALYEPTYDLARLILAPRIEALLETTDIRYRYNKSENIFHLQGYGKFIIRTLDNPARIVGYEAFRSHVDEIDTLKFKHAKEAWEKILARNRQKVPEPFMWRMAQTFRLSGLPLYGSDRKLLKQDAEDKAVRRALLRYLQNQVCVYSTPEGFNFVYQKWAKEPSPQHRYITAPTYSNPHLPEDYVTELKRQYDPQLVQAYIEGQFVNLTSGTVYRMFDRRLNNSQHVVTGNEPLLIGMDFNVGRGCAVIHVLRNNDPHAVDEVFGSFDTPDTIRVLKERYPNNPITIYPDAAGKSRKSLNATQSDLNLLKQAGYTVRTVIGNPAIKDRVASMNGMFCNSEGVRRYKVNIIKCPRYTEALEQQIYDKNGLPEKGDGKGDDINDAGGYYIAKDFPIVRKSVAAQQLRGF